MSISAPQAVAAQRALEAGYGLALEGLGEDQVLSAVAAAWTGEDDPANPRFLERVVDRLPIDESWLLREEELWTWLEESAGPEILQAAAIAARPARILSIGCSAGQEPFSAAIVFQRILGRAGIPPSAAAAFVQIAGIDPSPVRVEAARSGFLPAWSVQRCRPEWLTGRVTAENDGAGRYRVADSVRAMCRFEVGNLLDLVSPGNAALGGFDIVLCRHVLIYFRPAEAERVAERLGRSVDPGAMLVFSSAEAHLLECAGASSMGFIAAGRPRAHAAVHRRRPLQVAARPRPAQRSRGQGGAPQTARPPGRAPPAPPPVGPPPRESAISAHIRLSLEHGEAGRAAEALREARAALFHDPHHLYSRMLLGEHLIRIDEPRGREVLRDLLEAASRLPPEASVPCADGLSVGQLAAAVRLLLRPRGEP